MIELPGIHIGGGDAFQTNGVSTLEQAIKLNQDFLKWRMHSGIKLNKECIIKKLEVQVIQDGCIMTIMELHFIKQMEI